MWQDNLVYLKMCALHSSHRAAVPLAKAAGACNLASRADQQQGMNNMELRLIRAPSFRVGCRSNVQIVSVSSRTGLCKHRPSILARVLAAMCIPLTLVCHPLLACSQRHWSLLRKPLSDELFSGFSATTVFQCFMGLERNFLHFRDFLVCGSGLPK